MSHYSKKIRDMFRRGFTLISEGSQLVEEAYIMHEEELSLGEYPDGGQILRECPFCKRVPDGIEYCGGDREYPNGDSANTYAVCCTNSTCDAHGRFMLTEELAVDAWNDV